MTVVASGQMAIDPDLKGFESRLSSSFGGIAKKAAAAFGTVFAAQQVFSFGADALKEAEEARAIGKDLAQTFKTTGAEAFTSIDHINKLADATARKAAVDNDLIKESAKLLLTFPAIRNELGKGNDIFDQAVGLSSDLAARFKTDLKGATIQLGKALGDPVRGMTALARAGITFDDQQRKQIKTLVESGKTLQAQKVLLAALKPQIEGAAEANATSSQRISVAWADAKERVGTAILPIVDWFSKRLPAALDTVFKKFGQVTQVVKSFVEPVKGFFNSLRTGFTEDEGTPAENLALTLRDKLGPVLQKLADVYLPLVQKHIAFVREQFDGLVSFVRENMPKFQEAFGHVLAAFEAILPIIKPILEAVLFTFQTVFGHIINVIKQVVLFFVNIINGDFASAFGNLKNIVGSTVDAVFALLRNLPGKILEAMDAFYRAMAKLGTEVIKGLVQGIKDKAGDVIRALTNFVLNKIPKKVREFFGIGSPSKMFIGFGANLMQGLAGGIANSAGLPAAALDRVNGALAGPAGAGFGNGAVGYSAGGGVSVVVQFHGAMPTDAQAYATGQAAGRGIADELARTELRRAARAR